MDQDVGPELMAFIVQIRTSMQVVGAAQAFRANVRCISCFPTILFPRPGSFSVGWKGEKKRIAIKNGRTWSCNSYRPERGRRYE